MHRATAVGLGIGAVLFLSLDLSAQHVHPPAPDTALAPDAHPMWMANIGDAWMLMAMGQFYPMLTIGAPGESGSPLRRTGWYLSQPVLMTNLETRSGRISLRTTVNLEAVTQRDGELTFGGWGEGFIDSRHPHALLHEAMLSLNLWDAGPGRLSFSVGRGFAPYGTDDPMSRPVTKYPTNHHLSQVLERFTLNGVYDFGALSLEAGLFGGQEPSGPYDLSNIESFGDSYAGRVTFRSDGASAWELSASAARVRETHGTEVVRSTLVNGALRYEYPLAGHGATHGAERASTLYGLIEGSRSEDDDGDSYFAVLGEIQLRRGMHRPYARVEYATRPEYSRDASDGDDFFRYDHDSHAIGATRWLITTIGYGMQTTDLPASARPFIEVQHHRVSHERGPASLEPDVLYGTNSFFALSVGVRVFLGGEPMRMGRYGVLDAMTLMHHGADAAPAAAAPHQH